MKLKTLGIALLVFILTGCEYAMEIAKGHLSIAERVPFTSAAMGRLKLPQGFKITAWATGIGDARNMTFAQDGSAYVARRKQADVVLLREAPGRAHASAPIEVAKGIPDANDVALYKGRLYITSASQVLAARRRADGTLGPTQVIMTGLPEGGRHYTRTLGFGPDGMLYVGIGSSCNACAEHNPERAALLRSMPDGSHGEVFAHGLRNTIGFDWSPQTGAMWGMDQGSDERGPNEPPEELNELVAGGNYGWPYCFGDRIPDAGFKLPAAQGSQAAYCRTTLAPALTYQAHSSPLDFLFYSGHQFPKSYQGDAFVSMHGSWDRTPAVGYKLLRVRFKNGKPLQFEDFLTGFLLPGGQQEFGRPCGLALAPDGSLFLTDDSNGVIYRIRYFKGA